MKRISYTIITLAVMIVAGCSKTNMRSVEDFPLSNSANDTGVGASAKELLTNAKPRLVLEIQYMPGYQLQPQTITNITSFLKSFLNKTGGIQVTQSEIPAGGADVNSLADVAQIEQRHRTTFNTDSMVSVYILVTNGFYTNDAVLGNAFRNTSISIFGQKVQQYAGAELPVKVKVETSVISHELGHLLGLVDLGSPMQTNHRDVANGNHCLTLNCLMDYGIDKSIPGLPLTYTVPVLDTYCRADLRAKGGK